MAYRYGFEVDARIIVFMSDQFSKHDPAINIYARPKVSAIVLCAQKQTADGQWLLPDGRKLYNRADSVIRPPSSVSTIGAALRKTLDMSRQLGKVVPALPPDHRDVLGLHPDDDQEDQVVSLVMRSKRDGRSPFFLSLPWALNKRLSVRWIPRDTADSELGAILLEWIWVGLGSLDGSSY